MINEQVMQQAQSEEAAPASEAAEVLVNNIADTIWTPVEEGGAFEETIQIWDEGGPQSVGSFAGHIIREQVDRLESGATQSGTAMELPRDDLLFVGSEVINEFYEAIATQIKAGAQTQVPFPEGEELEDSQGEALIYATEAYTGTNDPKLDTEAAAQTAVQYMSQGAENGA